MSKLTLRTLGRKIVEKRGSVGIREAAQEIGISPATLSRVERGNLPDLQTFGKICGWLGIDPGEVLGFKPATARAPIAVHFRKESSIQPETAQALAQLILAAERAESVSRGNTCNPNGVE